MHKYNSNPSTFIKIENRNPVNIAWLSVLTNFQ